MTSATEMTTAAERFIETSDADAGNYKHQSGRWQTAASPVEIAASMADALADILRSETRNA